MAFAFCQAGVASITASRHPPLSGQARQQGHAISTT